MKTLVITYMLCVFLSVLLTPCSSSQSDQINFQSSHIPAAANYQQVQQLSRTTLPRRFRFTELMKQKFGGEDTLVESSSTHKQKKNVLGNKPDKKEGQVQKKNKGTWQEWIEGNKDTSEFFTMDYSHVKRRRPIHNKSVPISKNGP